MSKKARLYLFHEGNCLGWKIETPTGGQQFGLGLKVKPDGTRVLQNFLWEIPETAARTLKTFLETIAEASFQQHKADREKNPRRFAKRPELKRLAVERIKIKPYQEEMLQRILQKLTPESA